MTYQFIQARNYTQANRGVGDIWLVCLHDEEAPFAQNEAVNVANYFAGDNAPEASAHACVDNTQVVECVLWKDIAWHAPPNERSIGIEHSGYTTTGRTDWTTGYGLDMLHISAKYVGEICAKYGIPPVFIDAAGLVAGKKGITTHEQVSYAWHQTDHTDPGPGFPMDLYINLVSGHASSDPTEGGNIVKVGSPVCVITNADRTRFWEIGADGSVYSGAGTPFYGSLGGKTLNAPIVGAFVSASGNGYTLIGQDGGVYCFGDAIFKGSYPGLPAADRSGDRLFVGGYLHADGNGYTLVSDTVDKGVIETYSFS